MQAIDECAIPFLIRIEVVAESSIDEYIYDIRESDE